MIIMRVELTNILKQIRVEKKIKQDDVAVFLGVGKGTISNYENGKTEPDIDIFMKICDFYEVNGTDILQKVYSRSFSENDLTTKQDQILIKKYRTLDEKGKHTVDVVLDMEHKRCTEMTTLRIAGRDGIIEDKTVNKAEIDRALALLKGKEIKKDW